MLRKQEPLKQQQNKTARLGAMGNLSAVLWKPWKHLFLNKQITKDAGLQIGLQTLCSSYPCFYVFFICFQTVTAFPELTLHMYELCYPETWGGQLWG